MQDRPSGELFVDLVKRYPGQELLALDYLSHHVLVVNPRLLADLFVKNTYDFVKPKRISRFLRHVLGGGLILVEENEHKFLRKNTMPAFHFRHLNELYPMMWTKAKILCDRLKKEASGAGSTDSDDSSVIEIGTWASKVTLDIIGVAGMGRQLNVIEKGGDPIQELYEEMLEPSQEKLLFAASCMTTSYSLIRLIPWKINKLFVYLTSSLDRICRELIQEKRQAISEKGDDHFDILSLLIKSDLFTDEVLKDQLLTFLAAG